MNKLTSKLIPLFLGLSISSYAQAFYISTLTNLKTDQADHQTRVQLMSILETCGLPDSLDDPQCVIDGLNDPHNNVKDPSMAQNIVQSFESALSAKVGSAQCQHADIYAANNATGFCVLLLHYSVLESGDLPASKAAFDQCLATRVGGLAVTGNIAAQIIMRDSAENVTQKEMYENMLEQNTDPETVREIEECF